MRKKLDTRFPASRIKKIMQADEDIGKIAQAVPVLVSKALELFLQDLCDRTYDITLQRGMKTMSSLHLKQCVHSFSVFDFLRDTVNRVPDLGGSDAGGEDRAAKRRKAVDEGNDTDEDLKRARTHDIAGDSSGVSRGRGRPRGRGRGRGVRGSRAAERDSAHFDKCEDDPDTSPHNVIPHDIKPEMLNDGIPSREPMETKDSSDGPNANAPNFDLNVVLDENEDTTTTIETSAKDDTKHEEYPGWSFSDMHKMAIDPLQLTSLNKITEEEEDYDNEDG
ncbi:Transcription factor CBF/NF-Y/archaeal histone domain-containing protein [Dioscorea alata]|uniref:Transcription factor CBF/NF-Y/archaeal histone domain-containing protein n=1 Tax=Dioscorea alata TaxID=55571 RepID=A0ACB7U3G3_DIOAL|nr:Transcription factor CBF/NF-Y/archaeal histone domain-containing protein [Dioscorea alata]